MWQTAAVLLRLTLLLIRVTRVYDVPEGSSGSATTGWSMMRWLGGVPFLFWAFLGLTASAADPEGKPRVIVCLGDSITKGVRPGVLPTETFAALLEQQLSTAEKPVRVVNAGVGGEQTDQALARLGKVLNEHQPDVVTIMYGTNDSYVDKGAASERIAPLRFRANLVALVERVRRFGAEPVLMTEPRYAEKSGPNGIGEHCNIRLEKFVELTRSVAEELDSPLVDHFAGWSAAVQQGRDLRDWTTDGYHPNPAGHAEMAARMLAPLTPRDLPEALAWVAQPDSSIAPREWNAVTIPGVQVFRRPGAVYFVFRDAPRGAISFPRLNNVVKQIWVQPLPRQPEEREAMPGPWTPPVSSLLSLRQSPTTWTIPIEKELSSPAVVVLEVEGVPTFAPPGGYICRPGRDGVIVLPSHHALTHGEKLQFEPLTHKNTVGFWVNPKDWAGWKFEAPPGEYELRVFQGCSGHAGSDVVVRIGKAELPFQVAETGHFQNFRWRSLGRVTLNSADVQSLELRCSKLAKGAVMDVRQIRLVPVTPVPASSAANLWDSVADIVLPALTRQPPAAGRRCVMTLEGESAAYHVAYFPTDWQPGRRFPVLIEWTGNGPYRNELGDVSTGRAEQAELSIGLAGTDGAICLSVPYLDDAGVPVTQWWGTSPEHRPERTLAYARAAIADICEKHGGDTDKLVLTGFSRGAIAAHALGLHDDETARLWKGFLCFSHFDGVRKWPFAGSDPMSAQARRQRLGDRPVLVLAESSAVAGASLKDVKQHLEQTGANLTKFQFVETGFVNHDDAWTLRPSAARERARSWLRDVLMSK